MIRIVQMGMGPIGRSIAARVIDEAGLQLVGAVDLDAVLIGKDVGALVRDEPIGVAVQRDLDVLLEGGGADVVLHATGSFLPEVADQLQGVLKHGVNVVSTCEELAYPYHRHPALARELDAAATSAGAVLLGSGVNPGFVMDKLVVTLMAACSHVRSVSVTRIVDAATRRGSFQRKIGAGLTPEEFADRNRDGRMGHIGLAESAHMLADVVLPGSRHKLNETLEPVLATRPMTTDHVTVEPGQVAGIDQTATISMEGQVRAHLALQMYVGAERPRDAASIDGEPPLEVEIASGVAGDAGTVNVVVDCAHLVRGMEPGLRTMLDVPLSPPREPFKS